MKKKFVSRKGSAMLWAVLVMLMISLISAGIIFISRVYYVREQEESNRYQAKLYAQSAIALISDDIQLEGKEKNGVNPYSSPYVSETNSTETVTVVFPEAENWTCTVTISHSVVDVPSGPSSALTEEQIKKARTSGEIYLTAKVSRKTTGKNADNKNIMLELSEVCAKMQYKDGGWKFLGYYNL
ncbi:MAG: hypothetical protein ACI4XB_07650 [Ruminococcus sp.]